MGKHAMQAALSLSGAPFSGDEAMGEANETGQIKKTGVRPCPYGQERAPAARFYMADASRTASTGWLRVGRGWAKVSVSTTESPSGVQSIAVSVPSALSMKSV